MTQQQSRPLVESLEDESGMRCIDVVQAGGTYFLKEYRRDPEDGGRWTLVADYSTLLYESRSDAFKAISSIAPWVKRVGDL